MRSEEQKKDILDYQVRPSVQKEFMNLESDNPTKITLKDLARCLISGDNNQRRYYNKKLEKRDSPQVIINIPLVVKG